MSALSLEENGKEHPRGITDDVLHTKSDSFLILFVKLVVHYTSILQLAINA
jgi:hypothetical protein